jgi:hypothetical protein
MRNWLMGLLAAASWSAAADAALVRYDFGGTLTTQTVPGAFTAEAGLTGGTGSYSGYIVFDDAAPDQDNGSAELFSPQDFLLTIGTYAFSSAALDFAAASIDPSAPSFMLNFQSFRDFSPGNSGEFLNFSIAFPQAVSGLVQSPDIVGGTADLTLIGDADFLGANGDVSQFDSVLAVVPEPSTWATMIVGFGLVGAAVRRRRSLSTMRA